MCMLKTIKNNKAIERNIHYSYIKSMMIINTHKSKDPHQNSPYITFRSLSALFAYKLSATNIKLAIIAVA